MVLNKLDLLAKDGVHLLNAGAVLFCNSPMTDVQMAKFATNVKGAFTDIRREDRGSIVHLSKVCEQYIIDAMDWKADIIGLNRVETPEIPVEAVREAIINSYGHRVYNNNQCNEIDVFRNRIEIHTAGGFPQGYTPEEFLDGSRKAVRRNKLITSVLYYSKDMETFATGLKRIKDLCDEAGCQVEFRVESDDFVVVFYRNLRQTWNDYAKNDANESNSEANEANLEANQENRGFDDAALSDKVIGKLKSDPKISQRKSADELHVSRSTIQRVMAEMIRKGQIERIGGTRGEWKVN